DVLRDRWGADVVSPSGTVDRRRLAEIVFAPTAEARAELDFLNRTTRPPLFARFRRWLDAVRASDAEFAVLDAPLLFEVGWERDVDFVIFVEASRATRVRRVAERGWSPEELDRREANQLPLAVKRKRADFVLVNDDAPNVFNAENAENAVKNGKNDKNNKGERDAANAAPFSADATAQIARIVDEARRLRDARP
ncbi:MAG: dephospho-CoA kinase, partial [Thermoguttaceae bacterium]|nr:dephospho-CoA kinase [Thermoguttaceae bacterium]